MCKVLSNSLKKPPDTFTSCKSGSHSLCLTYVFMYLFIYSSPPFVAVLIAVASEFFTLQRDSGPVTKMPFTGHSPETRGKKGIHPIVFIPLKGG